MGYGDGASMGGGLSLSGYGGGGASPCDSCGGSSCSQIPAAAMPKGAPPGGPAPPAQPGSSTTTFVFIAAENGVGHAVSGLSFTCAETNQTISSTCAAGDQFTFWTYAGIGPTQVYNFYGAAGPGEDCSTSGVRNYSASHVTRFPAQGNPSTFFVS